ncbi:MAG: transporter substrate-binding domain-containing protein, partial [Planctomycetes bacterium]|nr:transporter substrate-binding domain-containing protein [Planctomycetota bacterium]
MTPRPRLVLLVVLLLLVLVMVGATPSFGQIRSTEPLVIGTKEAPPFAFKREDGTWDGISFALMRRLSNDLGFDYRIEERTLDGLFTGLEEGQLDLSIAALTVTPEREERVDFSHPYHTSGLAIATRSESGLEASTVFLFLKRLFSIQFFQGIAALGIVLLATGGLIWWLERRKNPEQFGGSTARGLGSGFWWSAVTMTTVGYGDKAPRSLGGRILTLFWMFAGLILASSFTAAITTALTV